MENFQEASHRKQPQRPSSYAPDQRSISMQSSSTEPPASPSALSSTTHLCPRPLKALALL